MDKFIVINGPNLNLLGSRETQIYGEDTLKDIEEYTKTTLASMGHNVSVDWFQFNSEAELISKIQSMISANYKALIINPAAYSHTSIAILDALKMLSFPVVEVHLSNTHCRESFRSVKLTAKASTIIMEGLGKRAYLFAILSQLIKG